MDKAIKAIIIWFIVWFLINIIILPALLMWTWNAWIPELFKGAPVLGLWDALAVRIVVGFLMPVNWGGSSKD